MSGFSLSGGRQQVQQDKIYHTIALRGILVPLNAELIQLGSTATTSNSKSGSWIASDVSRPAYPGGNTFLLSESNLAVCEKGTYNVILLSENPSYDPIMLSEGQVSILGIAVGVVKTG